jgi:hypothetical protein
MCLVESQNSQQLFTQVLLTQDFSNPLNSYVTATAQLKTNSGHESRGT